MDSLSPNLMVQESLLNKKLGQSILYRQSTHFDPFILILYDIVVIACYEE